MVGNFECRWRAEGWKSDSAWLRGMFGPWSLESERLSAAGNSFGMGAFSTAYRPFSNPLKELSSSVEGSGVICGRP